MATTKSSHRPPDKRIRNGQTTNLLRATACYLHHIFAIVAIRNIVGVGGGGVGFRDGSKRINTAHAQLTSVTLIWNVCLTFVIFFYFDDKSRINQHGRVRNKVFLQHIYYVTDDVILQRSVWIISNQHEKVPMLWFSAVPAVTKLKRD